MTTFAQATAAYVDRLGRERRGLFAHHLQRRLVAGEGTPVKTGRLRGSGDVTGLREPIQPPPPEGWDFYAYVPLEEVAAAASELPLSEPLRFAQSAPYADKVWSLPRYDTRLPEIIRGVLADATSAELRRTIEPLKWSVTLGGKGR